MFLQHFFDTCYTRTAILPRTLTSSICQTAVILTMQKILRQLQSNKPKASEVLTYYLLQTGKPPWTSYFVKSSAVIDDHWGKSNFNWKVNEANYHILRTGCYPYIKYHCTKSPEHDLRFTDLFFTLIKISNFGIPCLLYGIAAFFMITHVETVKTPQGDVKIYFLYPEDKGSRY